MTQSELVVQLGDRSYRVDRRWCAPPRAHAFGFISDVVVDVRGHVHVGHRGGSAPVLVFDESGRFLRSWGEGRIADIHYMTVTPDGNILVADRDAHQILEFDPDGALCRSLGNRHAPSWQAPFNHPTAAFRSAGGEVFVSDGYGNFAAHRLSPDGALLRTWGGPGTGPGEFSTPHSIWALRADRILVADRENNRVQVFDREGTWVDDWRGFYHPMKIYVDERDMVFVTDQVPSISQLNGEGELVGRCRGTINGAHGIWGDPAGNLYLAELPPEQVTRLTRIA